LTVRLPKPVKEALKLRASSHGLTLNILINEILRADVDCGDLARKYGYTWLSKELVRGLLDTVDEASLERLARDVSLDNVRGLLLSEYGTFSLDTFLQFLTRLEACPGPGFALEVLREGTGRRVVFRHDLGRQWSVFLMHSARALADRLDLEVTSEIAAQTVVFRFAPKNTLAATSSLGTGRRVPQAPIKSST
jgi:hypothetical protein